MTVSSLKFSPRHCVIFSCSRPARSRSVRLLLVPLRSMRKENTACDREERSFSAVGAVIRSWHPSATMRRASLRPAQGTSATFETQAPYRG